jgi:hypothetical protein
MKQMRGLLIAAIVLAGLSGLVYWSKKHKTEEAAKPAADASPKILTLEEKQVDGLTIQKTNGESAEIARIGDRWEIVKPEPMPADQDTVNTIVSTASNLTSDRLIDENPGSLQPFGLAAPLTSITLHLKSGKTSTLQLGVETPSHSATYAKLAGDPKVYSIAGFSKGNLDKSVNDLRDKRMLTFNAEKLSRVEVESKAQKLEFGKNAQAEWQILKPEPMRADGLQVDDLVRKLREARLQVDAGKVTESVFNAAPRVATVVVTDNGGAQTVEVRQDKDKKTYAKSSVVNGIYRVDGEVAATLSKSVMDYRSKKLFDFGFSEIGEVTTETMTYRRSGEKWFEKSMEMDNSSILNLVDKLRDLTAVGFATKGGGNRIFVATVITQDKKRNETVTITREGENTFAQRAGEPAIYKLDKAAADDVILAAKEIKPAAPPKSKTKKK